MSDRVSFQLYFTEGEHAGKRIEVMEVDLQHWASLKQVVEEKYPGILQYLRQELPIHLTRSAFLETEGEMRQLKDEDLNEDAYIAAFSLDIFIRQLDELMESDIYFEGTEA